MTVNMENQGYHYGFKWLNFSEKQPIIYLTNPLPCIHVFVMYDSFSNLEWWADLTVVACQGPLPSHLTAVVMIWLEDWASTCKL